MLALDCKRVWLSQVCSTAGVDASRPCAFQQKKHVRVIFPCLRSCIQAVIGLLEGMLVNLSADCES